jgi:hypothetical protein
VNALKRRVWESQKYSSRASQTVNSCSYHCTFPSDFDSQHTTVESNHTNSQLSPTQLPANMSNTQFNCNFCLEDKSEPPVQVRIIHGSMVCSECIHNNIVPRFRAALAQEHHYPPKWGNKEMEYDDFKLFLTSAEQAEWEDKIEEYNTPVPTRIYCAHKLPGSTTDNGTVTSAGNCNNFMSSTTLEGGISPCSRCGGWSCRECGGPYEVPADTEADDDSMEIEHICKEKEPDLLQDPTLEDRYQRCPEPTCGFIVSLHDGCNAMDCERCGTIFCYLCGEITTHDSDHWTSRRSECPRWNEPGDANAQFDPPAADHVAPDPPFPDPLGPLQRAPNDPVLDAFRVARDQIRAPNVEDNGQEARHPPPPNYAIDSDLGNILHDFESELEDTYGSVDVAPGPLRAFRELLEYLDTNIAYIRMVEERHEIFFPEINWRTDRLERAHGVIWSEVLHEHLVVHFMPTFWDAMDLAVIGSVLASFNPVRRKISVFPRSSKPTWLGT